MRSERINRLASAVRLAALLVSIVIFAQRAQAQAYNFLMSNNTPETVPCGWTHYFYDSGGSGSNYGNNQNYTKTFTSDNGNQLRFDFTAFNTQANNDILYIYDGPDTDSRLMGQYSGNQGANLGVFISSGTSMTFRFTSNANTNASGWAATLTCLTPDRRFYSYKGGNWNEPGAWTTNPSGSIWENADNSFPGPNDNATIRNGHTINVTANNQARALVLDIQEGATLNFQGFSGNFDLIQGQGLLRLSSGALPNGDMTRFVEATGGTVEFYGNANFNFDRNTFNNLILNLGTSARTATAADNLTVNGTLELRQGTLQINNNATSRTHIFNGDIIVEANGRITTASNNANHNVYIKGNLINNGGSVRFSNATTYSYTSDNTGRATVYFDNPTADQLLLCNGTTDFHKLVVDKGVDATYILDVQSNNTSNFRVLGSNNAGVSNEGQPGNVINNKSIEIFAGTLKLGANIEIPRLVTTTTNIYYAIDLDACLWLDGANVSQTNTNSPSSLIVYGKLLVTGNSTLNVPGTQGIILREAGIYQQTAGTVTASMFRTSSRVELGAHRGAFLMSGGTLTLTGDKYLASHATFTLPFEANTFQMSGGTIDILNPRSSSGTPSGSNLDWHSWHVNSAPENISVTGGDIIIRAAVAQARINSSAPFYNLTIYSSGNNTVSIVGNNDYVDGGSLAVPQSSPKPLVVKNNLVITSSGRFNPNNQNVTVGNNFIINSGGRYTPGSNTTFFNGESTQVFTNAGTIENGLNNLSLTNSTITQVEYDLSVRGNIEMGEGTMLRDMGRAINVEGNVINNSIHESQTGGGITLNGNGAQTLGGNGEGVYGNLRLNKTAGVTNLTSQATVVGNLRLAGSAAVLNIGTQMLVLGPNSRVLHNMTANSSTRTDFSNNRMVQTAGTQTDGGLQIAFASTIERLFPVGTGSKYTPARIVIESEPDEWGSITVHPVNNAHPHRTSNNSLSFFWRVTSQDFSGIPSGSLQQRFYYLDTDLHPGANEALYAPGVYNPAYWMFFGVDRVSEVTNEILFDNIAMPDGDFTAGETDAFVSVNAYYSIASGNWTTAATWTNDPVGNSPASTTPTEYDPVIIRNGHTITITSANRKSGSLQIQEGGVLDLGTTQGHNFGALENGKIYGNGLLRVSSSAATAQFPGGDFGDFLGPNGGTVEYYTSGNQSFTIPTDNMGTPTLLNEEFTSTTFPPEGWITLRPGGLREWSRGTTGNPGGEASIVDGTSTNPNNAYLVTPQLMPMEGNNTLSLDIRRYSSNTSNYSIRVSTTGTAASDFTEVASGSRNNNTYATINIDLSSYNYTPIYVAIVSTNRYGLRVDNVTGIPLYTGSMPTQLASYNHLLINPASGRQINLPTTDLTIHRNLTTQGGGEVRTNTSYAANISVKGNLEVGGTSTLNFYNGQVTNISVLGNLEVNNGAAFQVANTNTAVANTLSLQGNVVNNGTVNFRNGTRYVNVTVLGNRNRTYSGTGSNNFNGFTVDKGNSRTPLFDFQASSFVLNAPPFVILNGTARFSGTGLSANLSTGAMSIPSTGCLSVNGSTINVAASNSNDADLFLAGRIEVLDGILNVGNVGNNYHNDIEYPGAGISEIVVTNGTLNVNGQIRRSTMLATGALSYRQSGGTVNIYGRNRQTTRGLLEVVNPSSRFEMSGGNLNLVYGLANANTASTYGELYLDADIHDVTGGTITMGTPATPSGNVYFNVFANTPVWNLHVNSETNAKTARLKTFPINIKGNLVIGTEGQGANLSTFNTNGLNVTIGGNLINYSNATMSTVYAYRNVNQTTTFNGSSGDQHIENYGSNFLSFGTLVIANTSANGRVVMGGTRGYYAYGDLIIQNGTMHSTDGLLLYTQRDIYNYSGHTSADNASGIAFRSLVYSQNVYGSGRAVFGYINLVAQHLGVVANVPIRVDTRIVFGANAKLIMANHNLSLASGATIGAATATAYIQTNGVLSDGGVTREWNGNGSFTFPIGVTEKYTPVTINVTGNAGESGVITIKPVNAHHPSVQTGFGNDELQYYWNVVSSGFAGAARFTHTYNYLQEDVRGNENAYVGGRYHEFTWVPLNGIPGSVNATANTITLTSVDYVDGEYTAGLPANFADKPILYSRRTGNWNSASTWSTSPSGTPTASAAPDGNPIFIQSSHVVTLSANGAYAYSVDINSAAVLNVGTTLQHNLGHVTGGGTIQITNDSGGSFVFPGGYYDEFMDTPGSTVEYIGNGTIPSHIRVYQNVTFSGAGTTKLIPAIDFLVQGNLTINQGYLDNTNFNRTIRVRGNWLSNVANGFLAGRGTVTFEGLNSTIQAPGGENFYNLGINAAGGEVTLNSPVTVANNLHLTRGYFISSSTNLLTLNSSQANAVVGGSIFSYVDGPLRKMVSAGSSFVFPVGNAQDGEGRYGPTMISGTITSGNQYWTAQYFSQEPSNRNNLTPPLRTVSTNEYWTIQGASGSQANVRIRWDGLSEPIPATALGRQKLRVAKYGTTAWANIGQQVVDGGLTSGTIATSLRTVFGANAEQFTIGLDETATAQIISGGGNMCDDGSTTLPVTIEFTGDGPWNLVYSINGSTQPLLQNLTSPYTIQFGYDDLFAMSGAGEYVIVLEEVYDNNDLEGVILSGQATLTLLETPNPDITGPERVMINSTVQFTVPNLPDNSYAWSVSGVATGSTSGSTTSTYTVTWSNATGSATIQLIQTNNLTGCSRTVTHLVDVRNWPVIIGDLTVCAGSTETYSTNPIGGHTYNWSVVDGAIVSGQGTSQVTILWGSSAAGSITLVQGPSGNTQSITEQVEISPIPVATIVVDGDGNICDGDNVLLLLGRSNAGASFTFFISHNGTEVGTLDQSQVTGNPHSYTAAPLTWTGPNANNVHSYSVIIRNTASGCQSNAASKTVNVYKVPETGPPHHIRNTQNY